MLTLSSPVQQIHDPLFKNQKVSLFIKREDLLHPYVSGNKWRKLKYNMEQMRKENKDTILSFGGAYSNHIYALAAAGKLFGFKAIGIIRGEKTEPLNATLTFAKECGMELVYVDREAYKNKENIRFVKELSDRFNGPYILPEGGTNALAVKGCEEIVTDLEKDFDIICCACGTGGTISGIIRSLNPKQKAIGFCSLKGKGMLDEKVMELTGIEPGQKWKINYDYHFGGYAKDNEELLNFIKNFKKDHQIQLEQVYTGKMMFGIYDLIKKGNFLPGTKILAIHTGGIQGLKRELLD